ncbi:MAG: 4'-phosphopantetheinyl transferase superfamily protein [Coleofasciculaceae cyanobacterium SM2_1_6]|nr:4'-phosphopantetheinyl transferase superfamily protein [Coleofasciculaceae cyanobacterium SM2_1_6]
MSQQLPDWSTALVPQLSVDCPQLWQVSLSIATISAIPADKFQKLRATLSPDEQAKADRFYDPLDGQRYIMARGTLRSILSHYLHLDPSRIKFTYTPQGKPLLDRSVLTVEQPVNVPNSTALRNTQFPNIQFNLSHSQDLAVYGVMLDRPLGIDVEYRRPLKDTLSLAKRWFTPKEYTEICQSPDPTKTFFRFWTAKEAYLKATGTGLRHLSQVEICTSADGSLQLRELSTTPQQWSIVELAPAPGYVGALAILGNSTIPKNPEIPELWDIS